MSRAQQVQHAQECICLSERQRWKEWAQKTIVLIEENARKRLERGIKIIK